MTSKIPKVFVGKKRVMDYVYAGLTVQRKSDKVEIHARGKLTSKAVDVAEILRRKFPDSTYKVEIGSFEAVNRKGRNVVVSTIVITITF
jgi:DNA-binding protein Alba